MNITTKLHDAINSYRAGNVESFQVIYTESKDYIYNCIYKVMCNNLNAEEASKEVFNDTFMEISQSLVQLQDVEKYFSWAGTIATRKCIDYLRKNKNLELETPLEEEYPDDEDIIPEVIMQNREKQLLVKQIIDTKLSEIEKLCIVSYYYNGLSQPEIAAQLGIPENSVKTHLYRAKKKIKEAVLKLEKEKDVKLYSFAPFMLLLLPLELEMTNYTAEGVTIAEQITNAAERTNSAGTVNATSADVTSMAPTTAKTAGGMLMKTKIIIAAAVLLCIGAVVGTVAIVSGSRDSGRSNHQDRDRDASVAGDLEVSVEENSDADNETSAIDSQADRLSGLPVSVTNFTFTSNGKLYEFKSTELTVANTLGINFKAEDGQKVYEMEFIQPYGTAYNEIYYMYSINKQLWEEKEERMEGSTVYLEEDGITVYRKESEYSGYPDSYYLVFGDLFFQLSSYDAEMMENIRENFSKITDFANSFSEVQGNAIAAPIDDLFLEIRVLDGNYSLTCSSSGANYCSMAVLDGNRRGMLSYSFPNFCVVMYQDLNADTYDTAMSGLTEMGEKYLNEFPIYESHTSVYGYNLIDSNYKLTVSEGRGGTMTNEEVTEYFDAVIQKVD